MIGGLRVLLAVALTFVVGSVVAGRLPGSLRREERWAWAFAFGLLVQSALLLLAAVIGTGTGRAILLGGDLLVVAGALLWRRRRSASVREIGRRGAANLLLGLALLAWLAFLVVAISEPMWSTDFLAIWGLKGKIIFSTGGLPARLFHDPTLYWGHREYPLLLSLSLASLAAIAGEWNDASLALLFPAAELATLLALYGFLARRVSPVAGGVAALLTALCFRLYDPVNAGTAETIFALGAVLAASAFFDLRDRNTPAARMRLAAAALFCAAAKQEGTLWVVLLAILYFLGKGFQKFQRDDGKALIALLLPPGTHWLLLYVLRGPQTRREYDFHYFLPRRWPELFSRFESVAGRILTTEAREAAIPLAAIVLFLLLTPRAATDSLLLVLIAQILCYWVAFSVSSFDPIYAVDAAFRRLALTLFPTLALVLGGRLSSAASTGAPLADRAQAI
jgi:hypothetical protein